MSTTRPGDDEKTVEASMSPGPMESGAPRGRVIVVDDEPANVRLLARQLARDGHVVLAATNGDEALDLVAREQPDLVLMDVVMPRRDGYETCRALKENASTRLIPIVLVTALSDSADKVRGLEAGADDFQIGRAHV